MLRSHKFETSGGDFTPYDISRVDGGAYLTFRHAWIEPSVEFRIIDYDERVLPQNDYRATIVSFTLTKRFGAGAEPAP